MKIKFQAPKKQRFKKQFMCVELDCETIDWYNYAYFPESKEWREMGDYKDGETHSSSSCPCHSLKSAIRLIKKWDFPKGTMFRLCSILVGKDIYITK